jgi:hypothetical protein
MELVYRHPEGHEYGGPDVGVGGEQYPVIKEGSRQLIRGVPNHLAPLLEPHCWIPTGTANADMVEQAAQEALRAKAKLDAAKRETQKLEGEAKDAQDRVDHEKAKRDAAAKKDAEADKKK